MGGAPIPKWDPIGFEPWPCPDRYASTSAGLLLEFQTATVLNAVPGLQGWVWSQVRSFPRLQGAASKRNEMHFLGSMLKCAGEIWGCGFLRPLSLHWKGKSTGNPPFLNPYAGASPYGECCNSGLKVEVMMWVLCLRIRLFLVLELQH